MLEQPAEILGPSVAVAQGPGGPLLAPGRDPEGGVTPPLCCSSGRKVWKRDLKEKHGSAPALSEARCLLWDSPYGQSLDRPSLEGQMGQVLS